MTKFILLKFLLDCLKIWTILVLDLNIEKKYSLLRDVFPCETSFCTCTHPAALFSDEAHLGTVRQKLRNSIPKKVNTIP